MKLKYTLDEKDYDNKDKVMEYAESQGITPRMGYHAWIAGQAANGYGAVMSFFEDVVDFVNYLEKKKKI